MKTTTITGKLNAYLTEYSSVRPEDFSTPTDAMVPKLYYSTPGIVPEAWTLAGTATITVELVDPNALIGNKVDALRAQLQKHRADSHVTEARLEDQISKLLAISYEPEAA